MRTTALLTCERGLCCCRLIAAAHTLRLLSLLCREHSIFNMKVNIKIKFNIQHSTFNIQKVPSIETGSIVCSLAPWLSRSHPTCEEQCIFFYFSEIQTSADVRPRVRETVVRVRVRNAALRPVVSVTPNVQQLHDLLPFHCP